MSRFIGAQCGVCKTLESFSQPSQVALSPSVIVKPAQSPSEPWHGKRLFNFLHWTLIYSSNIWLVLHVQTCVVLITMKVACPPVSALDVGFKLSEYLTLNSFLLSLMALSLVYDVWQVALLVFSPGLRTECSVCWSTSERAAYKRPPVQHSQRPSLYSQIQKKVPQRRFSEKGRGEKEEIEELQGNKGWILEKMCKTTHWRNMAASKEALVSTLLQTDILGRPMVWSV